MLQSFMYSKQSRMYLLLLTIQMMETEELVISALCQCWYQEGDCFWYHGYEKHNVLILY